MAFFLIAAFEKNSAADVTMSPFTTLPFEDTDGKLNCTNLSDKISEDYIKPPEPGRAVVRADLHVIEDHIKPPEPQHCAICQEEFASVPNRPCKNGHGCKNPICDGCYGLMVETCRANYQGGCECSTCKSERKKVMPNCLWCRTPTLMKN